jgi:hypothetical protein
MGALTPAILDVLLEFKAVNTSNSQIIVLQFIKRFVSRNSVSREYTIPSKVAVYQYLHQNVDTSVNSGMLLEVVQLELLFLPIFPSKSPEIRNLLESTERLFATSIVPSEACDLLFQCCTKLRESRHAKTLLSTFLRSNSEYKSHLLTEQAAAYAFCTNPFSQNVADILPIAQQFFATWCAVVNLETTASKMNHSSMKNMFCQAHELALEALADPIMKVFSPVFALLNGELEVTPEMWGFVAETRKLLEAR